MKKVFLCIPTLASAGAERFVTELACTLNKEKYSINVVVTNNLNKDSAFYQKLIKFHIKVTDVSSSNYIKEVVNIILLLKKEQPDVVHTNVGAALHMLLPLIISNSKAKHIFTVHSMGYRIFEGLKKIIIKFCFKTKRIIPVAICDSVKKSLIESYMIDSDLVELVYNGVNTDEFLPACKKNHEYITFINVGTLYHIKNHQLLINAFAKIYKRIQNIRLIIVGDGELRYSLSEQIKRLNLDNVVELVGNQSDVRTYLQRADVYCCSSKVEGLPISVLEAMACGLPVITTRAGGVIDIVKNCVNGYVVDSEATSYSEKMYELATNFSTRKDMSKMSRKMAMEHDLKICAREYERIYEKYT